MNGGNGNRAQGERRLLKKMDVEFEGEIIGVLVFAHAESPDWGNGPFTLKEEVTDSGPPELLIAAMKELGEIAECIAKDDRPGHWKKELGDLCGLAIAPMLEIAGMDFETACKIGRARKKEKTEATA